MAQLTKVLWIDDYAKELAPWQGVFEDKGLALRVVSDIDEAISLMRTKEWDAYLVDLDLGPSSSGVNLIIQLRTEDAQTPVFVVSGHVDEPSWRLRLESIQPHISGVISKPLPIAYTKEFDEFTAAIESAVATQVLMKLRTKYGQTIDIDNLIGAKESKTLSCFTIMPFGGDFDDIYKAHIKPVIEDTRATCTRADEIYSVKPIVEDIVQLISSCDCLVADVTGNNPNVFYELGMAHALAKPVILIAQDTGTLPFDIRHIRTIVYRYTPRGMEMFEERLRATLLAVLKEVTEKSVSHAE
jgi:DNA-binding NarL/FixJ family response regulator